MRRAVVCAIALSLVALVENAAAEPLTEEQRKELVLTDEAGDAWLHDHCSFRGVASPSMKNAKMLGQVVELIDNGHAPLAKEFRCAERPPFWKGTWSAAPAEAVDCTEPKPAAGGFCVPPLAMAVPAPAAPAATPVSIPASEVTAPDVTTPVSPPPSPPPAARRSKARAQNRSPKPASSPVAGSAPKPGGRKLR